jgi:tRNA pseudouridine38-40 synthase
VTGSRCVKLTVAYDGTDFAGWQLQPRQRTVQGVLEAGLEKLLGRPSRIMAAGRTDAGVHAEGQVVSVPLEPSERLPEKAFVGGLNGFLPMDVAVRSAEFPPPGFDARRSSRGKHYRYRILNRPYRSPLQRLTHWELFPPLDIAAMDAAAWHFVGEHDFSAFRAADCPAKTTTRIDRFSVQANAAEREIVIDVRGTAFLKHMVRNLVGTLAFVGRHRLRPEDIPKLIAGRDRKRAGPTAPAHGLCLIEVYYA